MNRWVRWITPALLVGMAIAAFACAPPKPEPVKTVTIAAETYDPAVWGKAYPFEYETWKATEDERPAGLSRYKKGYDGGKTFDKLSEYPYMALLFAGWGFGVEYNEPRGHHFMLIDQQEVDPSRLKAGGACLTCKTPYAPKLQKEKGSGYYSMPYEQAAGLLPAEHRSLGAACIDCHDEKDMSLRVRRWTIQAGISTIGRTLPEDTKPRDASSAVLTHGEMRSVVCGQCHVTYVVTKDKAKKSTGVYFPWKGSKWGDISIENIIAEIQRDPANLEWQQAVTGFKVGYIRHPEFEFFTDASVHFNEGVSCADCHMPYKVSGASKFSDHNLMSPLKNGLRACRQCHPGESDELKEQVFAIQDRTLASIQKAGLACAVDAKLFEMVNAKRKIADPTNHDDPDYAAARDAYLQAFYRVVYLGAENSVGFHNPTEAGRIAADALAYAGRAEGILKGMLAQDGVKAPAEMSLELRKYLDGRGEKKLGFAKDQEFKDPFKVTDALYPENMRALRK